LSRSSISSFVNTFWYPSTCCSTSSSIMSTNPSPPSYLAVWMILFTSPSITGKPLKSLTASLHEFFQHAMAVCGFNSSIAALMNVIASSLLKDFQQSMTWSFGSASFAAPIVSKTWGLYSALPHLMIPWWSGWSCDVGFAGQNTTWALSSSMLMDWLWPGALSIISKTSMVTLPSPNIPWLQGYSIGGIIQWTTLPWPMPWGYFARRCQSVTYVAELGIKHIIQICYYATGLTLSNS